MPVVHSDDVERAAVHVGEHPLADVEGDGEADSDVAAGGRDIHQLREGVHRADLLSRGIGD